jgi:serine/threonine-protein kinase RsbW
VSGQVDVSWTLLLRREAASVSMARRMLRTATDTAGVDPEVGYDLALALTEACANVIEHAGEAAGYRVSAGISDERCWIDVVDDGAGFPSRQLVAHAVEAVDGGRAEPPFTADLDLVAASAGLAESGRGLMLIEALSDRVSIRNHPANGALIHFERDLRHARPASHGAA